MKQIDIGVVIKKYRKEAGMTQEGDGKQIRRDDTSCKQMGE